ncbi:MAG: DUF370 domain-containing protein [Candidatus Goldbacteria bacterium]|nr:DUF370 domain-containing protein [Candidatus Goldiibacteriota bacterium]
MIKYLHIGDNIILGKKEIIGIFCNDGKNSDFIEKYKSKNKLRNVSEKTCSFILCDKRNISLIYFSKINSKTLIKRTKVWRNENG